MTFDDLTVQKAREGLYRLFRAHRPAVVVVITNAGDEKGIALRAGKGRWDLASEAICSMLDDVDRVEMRDKDGGVMRVWNPPPPPAAALAAVDHGGGEMEVPVSGPEDMTASQRASEAFAFRMLGIVEDASERAVKRHMAGIETVLGKAMDMLSAAQQMNQMLMSQHTAMLKATFEATVARANATAEVARAAGAGDESGADGMLMEFAKQVIGIPSGAPKPKTVEAKPVEVVDHGVNGAGKKKGAH